MSSSKTFQWTQFFKDAGLPSPLAKRYGLVFEDNRISKDMLADLDKEILSEIGITVMGDVINILKHAKKLYAQEMKKKERDSVISTSVPSKRLPPMVSPHSTTPAQKTAVVSTTSSSTSATTKKKVSKRVKKSSEEDGREVEVAYIAYVEPSEKEVLKKHQTRPSARSRAEELYGVLEEGQLYDSSDSYQEYLENVSGDEDTEEDYMTTRYQSSVKNTRGGKLYSDDVADGGGSVVVAEKQQAGVIMLPGEGRDIFTTKALQKAAKVYESGEGVASERSRRLLESAGLIPPNVNPEPSIFSRLGYEATPLSINTPASSDMQSSHRKIIQLSKPSSSGGSLYSDYMTDSKPLPLKKRVVSVRSTSSSSSGAAPGKRRVISVGPASKTTTLYSDQIAEDGASIGAPPIKKRVISIPQLSSSSSSNISASRRIAQKNKKSPSFVIKSKMASDMPAQDLTLRLGVASNKGRAKNPLTSISSASTSRRASTNRTRGGPVLISSGTKRTGVFGYGSDRVGPSLSSTTPSTTMTQEPSSMVADEYEYQALRQRDIRSRLEMREREKAARRGGPLAGRLGAHEVFMRLE